VSTFHDGEILCFFGTQIAQTRLQIDVLSGDVLGVSLLALHARGQLTESGFRVFEVHGGYADGDVGDGRVFGAADLGTLQIAAHAFGHDADLFCGFGGILHRKLKAARPHDLAVGRGGRCRRRRPGRLHFYC